jgi:hypothetical protein
MNGSDSTLRNIHVLLWEASSFRVSQSLSLFCTRTTIKFPSMRPKLVLLELETPNRVVGPFPTVIFFEAPILLNWTTRYTRLLEF